MITNHIVAESAMPDLEIEIKPDQDANSNDRSCSGESLAARIEALVLSSDRPLSEARLAELLGLSGSGTAKTLRQAIDDLNRQYGKTGRSFRIENISGGVQILTLPQFGPLLALLHTERQSSKLSHAALETLSIVAYRQPIIRAEIEAIRGVACGEVLRGLLERRLLKIVGRAEELGRPMLYGTTKEFLKTFGLARLEDLPEVDGLTPPTRRVEKKPEKAPPPDAGPMAEDDRANEPATDETTATGEAQAPDTVGDPADEAQKNQSV